MLSPMELRNATYLDFEGEGKKRNGAIPLPHMAGLFRPNKKGKSGKYSCVFFKQNWEPVSYGISAAKCSAFEDFFLVLLKEIEEKDSSLIYWTMHEDMILKKYLSSQLYKRLEPRLFNLHPTARKYANRRRIFGHQESARNQSLENFFASMYQKRNPYPPFPLGAAEACRRIDTACKKLSQWSHFSDKQKSYAKDLIAYNEGDCRSTWLIAKRLGNFYEVTSK